MLRFVSFGVGVGLLGMVSACAPKVHPIVNAAQFDLKCPRSELHYTRLSEDMYGVRGCGKQTKYVRICGGSGWDYGCQWVEN